MSNRVNISGSNSNFTCFQEIWQSGLRESGYFKICPNNARIFTAYCDMKLNHATVIPTTVKNDTRVKNTRVLPHSVKKIYYQSVFYEVQVSPDIDRERYCLPPVILEFGKKYHLEKSFQSFSSGFYRFFKKKSASIVLHDNSVCAKPWM